MSYWPKTNKNNCNPILFVHIPKAAGTSIRRWYKQTYGKLNERIHAPITHPDLITINTNMPSFTIIRNPFDRALSFYKYRKQILEIHINKLADKNGEVTDELAVWHKGFDAWVENYLHKPWTIFDGNMKIFYPGGQGDLAPWANMCDYVTIDGKIIVDNIIKLENLATEFEKIKQITGSKVEMPIRNISNISLPNYRNVYTKHSRRIVERLYGRDLNVFNYNF